LIKASNSVISSDQARRKISVEAGNYIEISVQDTGTGMPPKVLEKIFEPFFTTKQVGEGTGLGLSVIHSIIDSHGGFLDVQSQVGKGSTFSIFLPESEDIDKTSSVDETIIVQRGNHEVILIIDDEESIRLMMKEILSNYDYKVLTADNGLEALNIVRENKDKIDTIISDMLMPGMDGVTTIKEIRKINKDVPIIVMSGLSADTPTMDKRLARNIQASLAKPFSAPDLLRTIADVLGTAR
ncbi:MAG: response regulator, partial [Candidatus Marinimicrobia bacterium]|nr:response regulator [Candidatus Neomarinimicrobiota bacterium]